MKLIDPKAKKEKQKKLMKNNGVFKYDYLVSIQILLTSFYPLIIMLKAYHFF